MTQIEKIVDYLIRHGSISVMEGFMHLGITCTGQRIGEIQQIVKLREENETRNGKTYKRWYLDDPKSITPKTHPEFFGIKKAA
jgi:hypothetical protein